MYFLLKSDAEVSLPTQLLFSWLILDFLHQTRGNTWKRSKIRLYLHQRGYGNPIEWWQSDKVWWSREILLGRSRLVVMKRHAIINISYCRIQIYIYRLWKYSAHIYIYIYIYIYVCVCGCVCGAFNKFQDFFTGILNCRRLLKIQCVIAIYLMIWLSIFYDFSFKRTATAGIGMHPTKA